MKARYFGFAYIVPAVTWVGFEIGGPWVLMGFVFVFGLTPLLDVLLGRDSRNLSEEDEARVARARRYSVLLWLWPGLQLVLLLYGLEAVTEPDRGALERAGLALSTGVVTGAIGITIGHELMHRRAWFERALAEALMTWVSYPHFIVEHIMGHHRRVATAEDPASARRGQTVYRFLIQTLIGSLRSAWQL